MNKPELYNQFNALQRRTTLQFLNQYSKKIKWHEFEDTAIDLGSGDGSVTSIVKNFAPCSFKKFVGCDISEEMVNFASEHYGEEGISFRKMDVGGNVPEILVGVFNHVFSFYTLQWIKNQEKVFRNIYNLLTDEGDCCMSIVGSAAIYDVYNALSNHPKWKTWLTNVDVFIGAYHNVKNPHKGVAEIMTKCGFKNIDVTCNNLTFVFASLEELKNAVQSVEPFNMPQEVFDEFMKDYITEGLKIRALNIEVDSNSEIVSVAYDYSLMVVYGSKN